MSKAKKETIRSCDRESYDLIGWEGGIAVYWMDGDWGTKIVAVPRLGLSTVIMNDTSDHHRLVEMLIKCKSFNYDREQASSFSYSILNDMKRLKAI